MSDVKDDSAVSRIITAGSGRPLSSSRRRFLTNTGMFSAGLVGSSLLAACGNDDSNVAAAQQDNNDGNSVTINGPSDAAVLQFALNLEYLEAEYYLRAVTGNGLMDDDIDGGSMDPGTVTGGSQVDFTGEALIGRYAAEIAADELDHVKFLRSGLGSGVISRPTINFTDAFNAAGMAAGFPNGFNPFASPINFLLGAFIFEDVGVTAYKGGAQFIRNRDFLTAAAGILSVEGYHAGLVRTILTSRMDQPIADGSDITIGQAVNMISDARDSLDGDSDDDQGIGTNQTTVSIYGTSYSATNVVPTDDNGITYSRTPQAVHNIVYLTTMEKAGGGAEGSGGGFFPNGTRGTLTASADQGSDDDDMSDNDMSDNDMTAG